MVQDSLYPYYYLKCSAWFVKQEYTFVILPFRMQTQLLVIVTAGKCKCSTHLTNKSVYAQSTFIFS